MSGESTSDVPEPPLGCPWCAGFLLPATTDRDAPHCTSGEQCPATRYVATDASLSFSGLTLAALIRRFHAAFRVHLASHDEARGAHCDQPGSETLGAMNRAASVKQSRTEDGAQTAAFDGEQAEGRLSEGHAHEPGADLCHRIHKELAPLVVSATPDEFSDLISPAATRQDGERPARGGARLTFYFLVCPVTGQSDFVA